MATYFFSSPVDVEIKLDGEEERKFVETKTDKDKTVSCPVFYDGDNVAGQVCLISLPRDYILTLPKVTVRVRDGKKLAHEGIKVEFVGSIGEISYLTPLDALISNLTRALLRPGESS